MTERDLSQRQERLLAALAGNIEPVSVSWLYRLGLLVVAIAMVLLPVIYVGLIVLVCKAVFWHAVHNASIIAVRVSFLTLVIYLAPIIAGGILVAFMVKPLFARLEKGPAPHRLNREQEPLLFAFVERVADIVGAPRPVEIHLDGQVNASASFRRGLRSLVGGDLVLTLGTPLIVGLDARQLAGVLAHEFGHFAQRSGMGLTYVIRSVNGWFAQVVFQRDSWDRSLKEMSQGVDLRIGVVFWLARFLVWLTRKILWVLMHVGHFISCFMLRQMEYDADRYEARVAGSEAFAATMERITVLGATNSVVLGQLDGMVADGNLPADLGSYTVAFVAQVPAEGFQKLVQKMQAERTRWFHTHPAARERIVNTAKESAEGIFRLDAPAIDLFADFDSQARQVSLAMYRRGLGARLDTVTLCPTDHLVRQRRLLHEEMKTVERLSQGLATPLRPLPPDLLAVDSAEDPVAAEQAVRTAHARLREGSEDILALRRQFVTADQRRLSLAGARLLLECRIGFPPAVFKLSASTLPAVEQAVQALEAERPNWEPRLVAWEQLWWQQLQQGLALFKQDPPACLVTLPEVQQARDTLLVLAAQRVSSLHLRDLLANLHLMVNVMNQGAANDAVIAAFKSHEGRLRQRLVALRDNLQEVAYPLEHPEHGKSLGEVVVAAIPVADPPGKVFQAGLEVQSRLATLEGRLLGRLALAVEAVEEGMGLEALPEVGEVGEVGED